MLEEIKSPLEKKKLPVGHPGQWKKNPERGQMLTYQISAVRSGWMWILTVTVACVCLSRLLLAYNSLTDKHLTGYFSNTRIRRHLLRAGLVRPVSLLSYDSNKPECFLWNLKPFIHSKVLFGKFKKKDEPKLWIRWITADQNPNIFQKNRESNYFSSRFLISDVLD